jgi:hypothetical protein
MVHYGSWWSDGKIKERVLFGNRSVMALGARPLGLGITHIFVGFVLDILICNLLMR